MLHVFASDKEKFGDTFYMHVPTFAERAEKKQLLEWYSVNYVPRKSVPRRPMPVIHHNQDSHVDAVKTATWPGPLATFTTTDYVPGTMVTVPLWRTETKTIVPLGKGATSVVVPRVAVPHIKTQLYDYPHIDKTKRMLKDHPLDIVFISNGEPYAEFNYEHLKWAVQMEGLDCNHIHHSKGVNGRVAAYQAAARLSTTPWFFAVFAKLEVDHRFDWTWQPDRMQQPKHYIFHAKNPLNGLVYGHQAMIAYNKKLALENTGVGLDFTLDQAHEVVPHRIEALHGAAKFCRTSSKYHQAYILSKWGQSLLVQKDGLFVEAWIWDYGIDDEVSVSAYWAGHYIDGLKVTKELLKKIPERHLDRVKQNLVYFEGKV
jgi:hypothetical protein